jgi:hypothetical protein
MNKSEFKVAYNYRKGGAFNRCELCRHGYARRGLEPTIRCDVMQGRVSERKVCDLFRDKP